MRERAGDETAMHACLRACLCGASHVGRLSASATRADHSKEGEISNAQPQLRLRLNEVLPRRTNPQPRNPKKKELHSPIRALTPAPPLRRLSTSTPNRSLPTHKKKKNSAEDTDSGARLLWDPPYRPLERSTEQRRTASQAGIPESHARFAPTNATPSGPSAPSPLSAHGRTAQSVPIAGGGRSHNLGNGVEGGDGWMLKVV
ncbi:hypothetical protein B0H14DRAFT_3778701 [Mycena olivaceomarginata]|nr:hypothetical protein B0H14DRAFT_3778701 [Mycena olivaceomarginata]